MFMVDGEPKSVKFDIGFGKSSVILTPWQIAEVRRPCPGPERSKSGSPKPSADFALLLKIVFE